eukprot:6206106-Pleurochrysis_carterae.AAC.1
MAELTRGSGEKHSGGPREQASESPVCAGRGCRASHTILFVQILSEHVGLLIRRLAHSLLRSQNRASCSYGYRSCKTLHGSRTSRNSHSAAQVKPIARARERGKRVR